MSTPAVSPYRAVAPAAQLAPSSGLTADALFTYCQTRLSRLDRAIGDEFRQQELARKFKEALTNLKEDMRGYSIETPALVPDIAGLRGRIQDDMKGFAPGTPQREALEELLSEDLEKRFVPSSEGFEDRFKMFERRIDKRLDAASSTAELGMIQLQSLMSQRQTAVQLVSNILAKLHQASETVVGNIR